MKTKILKNITKSQLTIVVDNETFFVPSKGTIEVNRDIKEPKGFTNITQVKITAKK